MGVWISYDLIGTDETSADYRRLISQIELLGAAKKVEILVLGEHTSMSPEDVRDTLTPYMDENDRLIVMRRVGGSAWRNLSPDVTKWLKEHPA